MKPPTLFRAAAPVRREVMRMVGPVILEQLLISSMGIVGIMLASKYGSDVVDPMGLVDALHFLFILFFTSIAAGATVIVAQHYGRGECAEANEAARQAMVTSMLISAALVAVLAVMGVKLVILLNGISENDAAIREGIPKYLYPSLLSYPSLAAVSVGCGVLRGSGDTRTPMFITVFMSILNALLSALLINGMNVTIFGASLSFPALKIEGAAIALLISRTVGAALISYVLLGGQRVIKLTAREFRFMPRVQRSLFSIGVPMTAESVLFQIGKIITGIIIYNCGKDQMNANIISGSIFTLICIPGNAFAVAAMPLVGQSVGRRDYPEARDRLLFVNWLSSLGLLLTCILMALCSGQLVSLYTSDGSVTRTAMDMLKVVAVFMPFFWSASFVLPAGLKGAGDVKYAMITSVIGMWVFRIALGYYLGAVLHLGAVGVYLGMCVDWVVRGALYYVRVRGKSWYKSAGRLTASLQTQQDTVAGDS